MPKAPSCWHQVERQGSWSGQKLLCAAGQAQREYDISACAPYIKARYSSQLMHILRVIFRFASLATKGVHILHEWSDKSANLGGERGLSICAVFPLFSCLKENCDCRDHVCTSSFGKRESGGRNLGDDFCGLYAYYHLQGDRERSRACLHRAIPWPHSKKKKRKGTKNTKD